MCWFYIQMIITAEACWNVHQHLCSLSPGHTNRLHFPALLSLEVASYDGVVANEMWEGCTWLLGLLLRQSFMLFLFLCLLTGKKRKTQRTSKWSSHVMEEAWISECGHGLGSTPRPLWTMIWLKFNFYRVTAGICS